MLVLTRKTDEEIIIGDSIRVRIGKLRGQRVRLLIDAPPGVQIRRMEARNRENSAREQVALEPAGVAG
jgi:carbon storage regulator